MTGCDDLHDRSRRVPRGARGILRALLPLSSPRPDLPDPLMAHLHLPVVPVAPVLSLDAAPPAPPVSAAMPCVLDAGEFRLLTAGRLGECHALRLLGIGPGDRVLLPAYHCISMLYPILWRGATPVYYRLLPDTTIDFDHLAAGLASGAKAVIATHFFGFAQPIEQVRALCDAHGAALIEDCAHAFFGRRNDRPLGSFGDYAIASPVKFFPVFDGGCLISARHRLDDVILRRGGPAFQIKALLDPLERATLYARLRPLGWLLRGKTAVWSWLKRRRTTAGGGAPVIGPSSSGGGAELALDWLDVRMSRIARLGMLRGRRDSARIAEARRTNYRRLATALSGIPGCRPLRPELPDADTVPYVLPLLVDAPALVFPALKHARVPVLRWEDMPPEALATCPVAQRYRTELLQLPCHQALRTDEIDWIAKQVRAAVAAAAGVAA